MQPQTPEVPAGTPNVGIGSTGGTGTPNTPLYPGVLPQTPSGRRRIPSTPNMFGVFIDHIGQARTMGTTGQAQTTPGQAETMGTTVGQAQTMGTPINGQAQPINTVSAIGTLEQALAKAMGTPGGQAQMMGTPGQAQTMGTPLGQAQSMGTQKGQAQTTMGTPMTAVPTMAPAKRPRTN